MSNNTLLILGLALLALYLWKRKKYTKGEIRYSGITETESSILSLIYNNLMIICNELGIRKRFKVKLHRKRTYTLDNHTIYIKPGCNGELYDTNSLMKTSIHELAHVIMKSMHSNMTHDRSFIELENTIEEVAVRLNMYDPNIDLNYEDSCKY